MRQTYRWLAGLISLGVLIQAAAIAYAWFDGIAQIDSGAVIDGNWRESSVGHAIHGLVGMIAMPLLGLALLVVSFFAVTAVPRGRQWAGIVLGLIVLQVVLAFVSFSAPVIGALHGINALAILGTSIQAQRLTATRAADMPAQGASVPV